MEKQDLNMIALLDQLGTSLENIGIVCANLYQKLLKEGIPEPLAAQMTSDWWHLYWMSMQKIWGKE